MGKYDANWRSKSTVRAMVGFPRIDAERISFAAEQAYIYQKSPLHKYDTIPLEKKLSTTNFTYTFEPKVPRYFQKKDR